MTVQNHFCVNPYGYSVRQKKDSDCVLEEMRLLAGSNS